MAGPDEIFKVRTGAGVAFARSPLAVWVQATLSQGRTLHEAAAGDPHRRAMRGRGTVYLIAINGIQCVVRRYLRGGGMRLLGDRYLRGGESRPEREAGASEAAIARGIRTPRVLAWAVYPAGAIYRADLVTEYMPDSSTLATLLFTQALPADDRRKVLEASGRLVARMAAAGLHHTDLNARNILLQRRDDRYETAALDLDRMVVSRDGRPIDPATMLARLERSIRKISREGSERLTAVEWQHLRAGAANPAGEGGKA